MTASCASNQKRGLWMLAIIGQNTEITKPLETQYENASQHSPERATQDPMFRPFRAMKPTIPVPRATAMLAKLAWPLPWADMFRPLWGKKNMIPQI